MLTSVSLWALAALARVSSRARDEDGQTLAEYSLIISAIAVAVTTIAVISFRAALVGAFNSATDCLNTLNVSCQ